MKILIVLFILLSVLISGCNYEYTWELVSGNVTPVSLQYVGDGKEHLKYSENNTIKSVTGYLWIRKYSDKNNYHEDIERTDTIEIYRKTRGINVYNDYIIVIQGR